MTTRVRATEKLMQYRPKVLMYHYQLSRSDATTLLDGLSVNLENAAGLIAEGLVSVIKTEPAKQMNKTKQTKIVSFKTETIQDKE